MALRLFVTGGSGFVGSRLLATLGRRGDQVVVLDRSGAFRRQPTESPGVQVVTGTLLEPDTYRHALATSDIVLHLAAATGRATDAEHFRVNAQGTELLLEQCRLAGVRKFLFVSSIATTFPDITHYAYARAKVRAEEAVRRSDLQFAILRPTMILGRGSPILAALEKLAVMPVIPVFGNGRALVQPIDVDDVVGFILTIIDEDLFSNETFAVGGPDTLSMEELLQNVRQARKGGRALVVHVPFGLLLPPLRAAEAIGLGSVLPVGVGQLSSFRYDSSITTNRLYESRRQALRSVPQMLSLSFERAAAGDAAVERECLVFTQHLLGRPPEPYVVQKYVEAHAISPAFVTGDRFDRYLLWFARAHRICAKVADAYARVFLPASALRRKLVLLLAILETCPPSYRMIDDVVSGGRLQLVAHLAIRGCAAVISLFVGTLILSPARLALAVVERRAR